MKQIQHEYSFYMPLILTFPFILQSVSLPIGENTSSGYAENVFNPCE